MKRIAKFISILYHPLFLFTYVFLFFMLRTDLMIGVVYRYNISFILTYIVVSSVIIPLGFTYFFKRDIYLKERKSRAFPLIITLTAYIFMYVFLRRYPFPPVLLKFLLSLIIGLFIILILNSFKKISLHSSSAGALLTLFIYFLMSHSNMLFIPMLIVIILGGLSGTARLILNAHTSGEVYLGYIIGIGVTLITLIL